MQPGSYNLQLEPGRDVDGRGRIIQQFLEVLQIFAF
jgi:hypothetical protein